MRTQSIRFRVVIGPRCRLILQVSGLGQFQLDRVDATCRLPVMPRRPTALETTIDGRGISRSRVADPRRRSRNRGRTGDAHIGADVKVRQGAIKQEWDVCADRMTVE